MKGTVFFRPSRSSKAEGKKRQGTWTYAFSVTKAGGKRQVTKGGFSTRRACEAALAEALVEHGRAPGQLSEPSKMLVGQFLRDEWLPTKARLKPTTRGWYAMAIESYVQPHLGHIRLSDLTPGQISKMYQALRAEGSVRKGKGGVDLHQPLTERSVHKVHVLMTSALGYALVTGRIRINPVAMIPKDERPKQNSHDRPEMRTWTAKQARQFLRATSGDRFAPICDLALNTGLAAASSPAFGGPTSTSTPPCCACDATVSPSRTRCMTACPNPAGPGSWISTRRRSRCCARGASASSRTDSPGARRGPTAATSSPVRTALRFIPPPFRRS